MQTRRIGDREISAIGLGGMPMSIEGRPDRERSIATIHAALDAGITFIDTADAYHLHADDVGHNEELIAEALASYGSATDDVLVATKGGHLRPGDGSWTLDGRPEYIKQACEASLKRLGVEAIGLYQFHRPDPKVPYEESVGAIRDLLDEGKILMAGISNADPDADPQAQEILGGRLVSACRTSSRRRSVERARARPLRRAGHRLPAVEPARRHLQGRRSRRPVRAVPAGRGRARGEPAAGVPGLDARASRRSSSRSPGSSRPETIRDSAKAVDLQLTPEELSQLG